ncbi:hypothetical protein ASE74_20255 [Pedobacter sp. Leaf216]|uniref:DUF1016 N-terminal domain-containing protein n=1 Tax=Pedobacter sp. Leaf216 TaxID=1735684 RepID=UPI0006F664FE|nr:DUF1016 N-terminal domain-containing protein [Pedobacter sp. Leaf216]KQM75932.1 hypothetical protein ASE74_20255 [Pedobacter sp. Leaf216]
MQIQRQNLYTKVIELLNQARQNVTQTINNAMATAYFEIGRMIIEEEQQGKERAEYGKQILNELSERLVVELGKGFSKRNLEQMRQFYLTYSIAQTVSAQFKLTWSHYLKLMRIKDLNERNFYEIEALKNNWSLRELQRQYDSALYTRLTLSKNKKEILSRCM